ncbi:hypothetical protein [Brochothrix campestris]|uniref:Uncharacterized protein n=1 Tax=Brochothrix campestris FSL F6-1037 TaxID=1265861 RepID=W7CRT8_9LIST|nr:hypothetical protein [Brochothrix campestris]EUJ39330.1 hypothetical protein BCAMP_07295 [Brochothrix campestris FSL F6-1037]
MELFESSLATLDLIVDLLVISDEVGCDIAGNITELVGEELQLEVYHDFVEFLYPLLGIVQPLITTKNKAALIAASAALAE